MVNPEEYRKAIASPHWRALKKRLRPKDNACAHCKKTGYTLELHHKTYERLGHEKDTDVEFLCAWCHGKADKIREDAGRKRSAAALYSAQLDGWARKVYGENWQSIVDEESIQDEFDNWVADREEREEW